MVSKCVDTRICDGIDMGTSTQDGVFTYLEMSRVAGACESDK